MLYKSTKDEAINIHKKAVEKYNRCYQEMTIRGEQLYRQRQKSLELIGSIEDLINSLANSPKEIDALLVKIQAEVLTFHQTEEYAQEALTAAKRSGGSIAASVAAGTAVASLAPSAAMWVATTFGTASTGTAISTLSGAAATKAALAWLGGGALSAGGAGVAGGQALLALAGPIGWGIAGVTTATSIALLGKKNKKIADQAMAEAKRITIAGATTNEISAKIQHITDETILLFGKLNSSYEICNQFYGTDYQALPEDDRLRLGALVNNAHSLAALLNKTISNESEAGDK